VMRMPPALTKQRISPASTIVQHRKRTENHGKQRKDEKSIPAG